jgi:hypothetical protein
MCLCECACMCVLLDSVLPPTANTLVAEPEGSTLRLQGSDTEYESQPVPSSCKLRNIFYENGRIHSSTFQVDVTYQVSHQILYAFLASPILPICPAHCSNLGFTVVVILDDFSNSQSSSSCNIPNSSHHAFFLRRTNRHFPEHFFQAFATRYLRCTPV